MIRSRRRPLWGLVGLVACNFFLVSFQVRSPNGDRLIRTWLLSAVSPFVLAAEESLSMAAGAADWIREIWNLREENRRLWEENWRLQISLHRLENLRRQWEKDAAFRVLAERFDYSVQRALVVQRRFGVDDQRVWINVGREDGVEPDLPVVTPEGVVGRVLVSGESTSEVELLIDPNAAAGAMVEEIEEMGIAAGTGDGSLLLRYLPLTADLEPGQAVVTSGTDGIYPPGLLIGRIVAVQLGPDGTFQEARLEPSVSFSRLSELAVLRWDSAP
ncbi:MAG TPA: rod shape-determining protein MreC [Acidobacteriota bacterium]|nr:rod shape-determining protein MreC [Acidobacteriota bacterium]